MGQPKLLRAPSLLAPVISSSAEGGGVGAEYTCGRRPLPRTRSTARSAPIINGPSVRAGPLVRTLLHARPPARAAPRWRDFGCADVSGNPLLELLSPSLRFPGPETDGAPGRPLSAFFVSPRITTGKTARKMHLLCKHVAAVTREDGWKEELVTHSGAIQLRESLSRSLSLSGVVIDGRTDADADSVLSAKRVMYRVRARPASV